MVLTSISVVGQPSVLNWRRIHLSSKYHPGSSRSFSAICSSLYVGSFLTIVPDSSKCSSHYHAAADHQHLSRNECGVGRCEEDRGAGDIFRSAPTLEWRGLGDSAVVLRI